jgi:hypothetical protein
MGSKSIKGDVVSYLYGWRPQRRRRRSLFAAQDQLFIKVNKFLTVKKFDRLFWPLTIVGDSWRRLKTVRPCSEGQNLPLPATLSPFISF